MTLKVGRTDGKSSTFPHIYYSSFPTERETHEVRKIQTSVLSVTSHRAQGDRARPVEHAGSETAQGGAATVASYTGHQHLRTLISR